MSKYTIKYSGRFKKAYKRCIKRGCDHIRLVIGMVTEQQ